jgi:primosomal protein DnaI
MSDYSADLRKIVERDLEFKTYIISDNQLPRVIDYINKRDSNNLSDGDYILSYKYSTTLGLTFYKQMTDKKKNEIRVSKIEKIDEHTFIDNCLFEDVDLTHPVKQEIVDYLKGHINNKPGNEKCLYIYGKTGSGKSFILSALSNELINLGKSVVYMFLPQIYTQYVRSRYEAIEFLDSAKDTDCLIIDEFGSGVVDRFFRDNLLFPLIQYRVLNKKDIFFASNRTLQDVIPNFITKEDGDDRTTTSTLVRRVVSTCIPKELN